MGTTTLDIITSADETNIEPSTFQVLWKKIEKYENRNKKATVKVDKLYDDFESIVLPYERKLGDAHCLLIAHFISFFPSNELKKKDKLNLLHYLDEHFDRINKIPFRYDPQRTEHLNKQMDKYSIKYFRKEMKKELDDEYDYMKEMLNIALGEDIDLPDEKLKSAILSGDLSQVESIMNDVAEKYQKKQSSHNDFNEADWGDYEFEYYEKEDDESSKITEVFKASQLNKMYKKIANIIHPDKELDPNRQEEKHKQMQLLVTAKNEGDVFTLIKMYQEFVPDKDYFLDENSMQHIEHLLQMKLQKLNQEHRDIFNSQGIKSFIWKTFSDTSKKKTLHKMEQQVISVEKEISHMNDQIAKYNNVKQIKKLLRTPYFKEASLPAL